jgi:hypothetical protein
MRANVMSELVAKARSDETFRSAARTDLEGTLASHGFDLTEDELAAARAFQSEVANLSDEELERLLSDDVSGHGG